VSARVFMSAPHVPRVLAALANALRQFEQRYRPRPPGPEKPEGR
jgi:hypothetical protein